MSTIPSNHIRLYNEEHGDGQSLVFILGPGSSTNDWEFQLPEFSESGTFLGRD